MKNIKNELSFAQVGTYAVLAELGLIALQWIYILIHNAVSESQIIFNQYFVKHTSFYVFLGLGFVVFMILAYYVMNHISKPWYKKILTLFIVGSIVEVLFYVIMLNANYEGVLLYSVADKFLGVLFGIIIFRIGYKPHRTSYSS